MLLRVAVSSVLFAALFAAAPARAQVREVRPEPPRPTPAIRLGAGLGLGRGGCPETHPGCALMSPLGFGGRGFASLALGDGVGLGITHDRGRFDARRGPAPVHHFTGVFLELSTGYSKDSMLAAWLATGWVDTNGRIDCEAEPAAGKGVQMGARFGSHVARHWSLGGSASVSGRVYPTPECPKRFDEYADRDIPVLGMALFALELVYDVVPPTRTAPRT